MESCSSEKIDNVVANELEALRNENKELKQRLELIEKSKQQKEREERILQNLNKKYPEAFSFLPSYFPIFGFANDAMYFVYHYRNNTFNPLFTCIVDISETFAALMGYRSSQLLHKNLYSLIAAPRSNQQERIFVSKLASLCTKKSNHLKEVTYFKAQN